MDIFTQYLEKSIKYIVDESNNTILESYTILFLIKDDVITLNNEIVPLWVLDYLKNNNLISTCIYNNDKNNQLYSLAYVINKNGIKRIKEYYSNKYKLYNDIENNYY